MRFSSRSRFLYAAILTGVVVAGALYGFLWMAGRVRSAESRLTEVNAAIARRTGERRVAREVQMLAEARQADLDRIRGFFVDAARPLPFVERLETLGRETRNLLVLDYDEGRSSTEGLFFRLTVEGNSASVRKFLRLLETLPYRIEVESVSFHPLTAGAGVSEEKRKLLGYVPNAQLFIVLKVAAGSTGSP